MATSDLPDSVSAGQTGHVSWHEDIHDALAGRAGFGNDVSMGGNKITNLDTGTATTDAVNKGQMDAAISGSGSVPAVSLAGDRFTVDSGAAIRTVNEYIWVHAEYRALGGTNWCDGASANQTLMNQAFQNAFNRATSTAYGKDMTSTVAVSPGYHYLTAEIDMLPVATGAPRMIGIGSSGGIRQRAPEILWNGTSGSAMFRLDHPSGPGQRVAGAPTLENLVLRAQGLGDYCFASNMKFDHSTVFMRDVVMQHSLVAGIYISGGVLRLYIESCRFDGHQTDVVHIDGGEARYVHVDKIYLENKSGTTGYGNALVRHTFDFTAGDVAAQHIIISNSYLEISADADHPYAAGKEWKAVHLEGSGLGTAFTKPYAHVVDFDKVRAVGGNYYTNDHPTGWVDKDDSNDVYPTYVTWRSCSQQKDAPSPNARGFYMVRKNGSVVKYNDGTSGETGTPRFNLARAVYDDGGAAALAEF